jgi:RNA polymerase sigma-70 factor (ECF subfamily)
LCDSAGDPQYYIECSDSYADDLVREILKNGVDVLESEILLPMAHIGDERYEDAMLVQRAQQDIQDFDAMYAKYYKGIASYFSRRIDAQEVIEDLVQDVFVRALVHLDTYRSTPSTYGTYLRVIAKNTLINHYRLMHNRPTVEIEEIHAYVSPVSLDVHLDTYLLLTDLNEADAQLLTARYLEGKSIAHIASECGATENAIKLRISRLRKKIHDTYAKKGD